MRDGTHIPDDILFRIFPDPLDRLPFHPRERGTFSQAFEWTSKRVNEGYKQAKKLGENAITFIKPFNYVDAEIVRGIWAGLKDAQTVLTVPAFANTVIAGARARNQLHTRANRAATAPNRFFTADPSFVPLRVLTPAEKSQMNDRLHVEHKNKRQKNTEADQREIARRRAAANHETKQAKLAPYLGAFTGLRNARAAVLSEIGQERQKIQDQYKADKKIFNEAQTRYNEKIAHFSLYNPFNWVKRFNSRRDYKLAKKTYEIVQKTYNDEMKRLDSESSVGLFRGRLWVGRKLRKRAIAGRKIMQLKHAANAASHEAADNLEKVEIQAIRDTAKQAYKSLKSNQRKLRWLSRKNTTRNFRVGAKLATNNALNSIAATTLRTRGNVTYGAAWAAAAAVAVGVGVAGGAAGATIYGYKRGVNALNSVRAARTASGPAPA